MIRRKTASPSAYRIRLIAGFTIIVALLAGAWAWSLWGPFTKTFTEQQQDRLKDIAHTAAVALESTTAPLTGRADELAQATSLRVTIIAADGTVLADSDEDPSTLENHDDRPEVMAAYAGETGVDIRHSETQGLDRVYVAIPATYAGQKIVLRVSEPLASVTALTGAARQSGIMTLILALALAIAISWRLTQSAAQPIERLVDAAHAMAAGNLTAPVPQTTGALAPLSQTLGTLRDQLRTRINALEAEEETLRTVLDGLTDAVFLLDGVCIRMANRALTSLFSLTPGDLTGRNISEIGLPASVIAAITTHTGTAHTACVDLGPDPFLRYHRVTIAPLDRVNGGLTTLVVISDLTPRMRLDAVRRDFVSNASHELKTPATGILLLAESAKSAICDGEREDALHFIEQLTGEAARLRRLVAELLDLSRIESVPGADEVTDVRRAIDLALAGHQRAANAKALDLSADLSAVTGLDIAVKADPTDVAIILDNLLANAVTYTESGSIVIRVSTDSDMVTIDVADTGIGIPAECIDRVFERFYRVDRARSRMSGGTGLGLSLVRNIAEKAGGIAAITSEPDTGTTVTIRLPQAK